MGECSCGGRCIEMAEELADLRAENQRLCAGVLSLEAERDELQQDLDRQLQISVDALHDLDAALAERDRYRAALERIATPPHPFMRPSREETIAKNALNGSDDE